MHVLWVLILSLFLRCVYSSLELFRQCGVFHCIHYLRQDKRRGGFNTTHYVIKFISDWLKCSALRFPALIKLTVMP